MIDRRRFLIQSGGLLAGSIAQQLFADDKRAADTSVGLKEAPDKIVPISVTTADELQRTLHRHAGTNQTLRLDKPVTLTCAVREELVGDEKSSHPLLIPPGVRLDLNGSTLLLDLRSNSCGVRLSNDSALRNGTIRVVRSEGKGSQACWHSGISIGAAYGDGGTPDKPGRFSTVSHWEVENITIDQPFAAAAVQLMSEACHGIIRNLRVLDSPQALLGVGLDWGSVGPMTSEDKEIPRMRKLWEQGLIYSTHPHDILIENIRVGRLTRNVDGNDAGVRCSACHRITIRHVEVREAATAVAIFGGDLGYEFARRDQRDLAHSGYLIEDVKIAKAQRYGIALNGSSDNVWRAHRQHGYDPVRDPVHPGIDKPVIRNAVLHGGDLPNDQGIYAVSVTDGSFHNLDISGFDIGVHVEDWVRDLRFHKTKYADNKENTRVEGATEPATGVVFDPPTKDCRGTGHQ